nr:uncharacterized protein LOC550357 isoform X2 [Danio rerio]|eukprot:XP_021325840.1 uncharacterized protein LOC550357 isoform X2 [Danio rerio]
MSKGKGKQVEKDREAPSSPSSGVTLAEISALHEELRASLAADFKASFESLDSKLENINSTVAAHDQRISCLESGLAEVTQHLEHLETACAGLTKENEWLRSKMSDLEGRSRRQNIRIVGLPESIEGPRPTNFFSEMLAEVFGDQILASPPELDRAHRIPAPKPAPGQRPRPVVLRFHRYQVKDLVVRESRKKGILTFRNHKIRIFEDYSPDVLKLRSEFKDAMAELYKRGLRPALLFPAKLRITLPNVSMSPNGSVHFIPCQQRYENFSSWPRSPVTQFAVHSRNGTYIVSNNQGQATTGGMSGYQMSSPASGLSQVMDSSPDSLPSPQLLAEEASRKRELRLMKNREAARECRRKKKEYVKCLENRVAVLEKQNKTLIEELKALKDIYCCKNE